MLTNINAAKVCKLLYICAIIYDLFYWIKYNKKKLQYFMILFHMYSTKGKHYTVELGANIDANHTCRIKKNLGRYFSF